MFDLVIRNGTVIDPANRVCSRLDLAVADGRIAALGTEEMPARESVDAEGLCVAPGFVDLHMHEDVYDADTDAFAVTIFESMLRMGVTTVVGGNCGIGADDPIRYLDAVDRLGTPVNVALYAAHSGIRKAYAPDNYAPVGSAVIAAMEADLEKYLDGGCVGVSFGLRYVPGTTEKELHALARVAGRKGKLLAAHARDDAAYIHGAVKELTEIARRERMRVQISHIGSMAAYGQMEKTLSVIDAACGAGHDVGLDCYPYNAFCTAIGSATYDPGFLERYAVGYDAIEVSGGKYRGMRCTREIFDEVRRETPEILAVAHVMREDEVDMALAHPRTVMASDGILFGGSGHPRAAGSFPRFLGRYVREKKITSLSEGIAKITCMPAERAGIAKGTLRVGADADIVLFDFEAVRDTADFAEPLRAPEGIVQVFLGGKAALREGRLLDATLGRALRV